MTRTKNPTYASFMNEVENYISNLSKDDLIKILLNFAESQEAKDRSDFLSILKNKSKRISKADKSTSTVGISSSQLIKEIKEFEKRIQDGEFYDEEKSYWASEREEHSY